MPTAPPPDTPTASPPHAPPASPAASPPARVVAGLELAWRVRDAFADDEVLKPLAARLRTACAHLAEADARCREAAGDLVAALLRQEGGRELLDDGGAR